MLFFCPISVERITPPIHCTVLKNAKKSIMFGNEYMAGPFQTSRYIGAIQNSFASLVVESKQKCENTVIKIKMQMQLSVPIFAHCALPTILYL